MFPLALSHPYPGSPSSGHSSRHPGRGMATTPFLISRVTRALEMILPRGDDIVIHSPSVMP